MNVRYRVELSQGERAQLAALLSGGKHAARKLKRAQILLAADAGARVIKIERPEGDFARGYDGYVHGLSTYFVWLNRGKQSVTLDFKKAEDSALLQRLIGKADVLIQNLAPGAADRAGFGSAAMRAKNKRLITVDVSGYGDHGPYKNRRAYDLLVQAESGLASITGTEHAPGRVGISATDIGTGSRTTLSMIASEVLGIPLDKFRTTAGDTDAAPYDGGSYGNRTLQGTGRAVEEAARGCLAQVLAAASPMPGSLLPKRVLSFIHRAPQPVWNTTTSPS